MRLNTNQKTIALFLMAGFCLSSLNASAAEHIYTSPVPKGVNSAAFPTEKDNWRRDVQNRFDKYSGKSVQIIFDGDSITSRWEGTGRDTWKKNYEGIAADFGIEGDRTENLLWRLSKGQVDGMDPKVVVIMIGTNNTYFNSAEEISEGIKCIVDEYMKRCPHAHIILMGVFPRGETSSDQHRIKMARVNQIIKAYEDDKRISFVDIGSKLMNSDGTISKDMMPDFVHPTAKGYEIWADAIQPIVSQYVKR